MVKTSLIRQSRLQERLQSSWFKIGAGWLSLIGISIFCFTLVKKNATEQRKEHLRLKQKITQQIIEEVEKSER